MESGSIPDSSISASSFFYDRQPRYARLGDNVNFWSSDPSDSLPWIQVDLGSNQMVAGLQTKGNYETDVYQYWVEQIKAQVGMTELGLKFIEDVNGQQKVLLIVLLSLYSLLFTHDSMSQLNWMCTLVQ